MDEQERDRLVYDMAEAIWTEVHGPLGRGSMENLTGHPLNIARVEAVLAVLEQQITPQEELAND